jgi:hypothetical protein
MAKYKKVMVNGFIMEYINRHENMFYALYAALLFCVPFLFSHPQWMVGVAVNMTLAFAAFHLSWKKMLPLIVLPSVGALASGIVLGPLSVFLLYMMPFIWLGNAVLVYIVKNVDKPFFKAPLYKAGVIFAGFLTLYFSGVVPGAILIAMGPLQAATALVGVFSALQLKKINHTIALNPP